MVKDNTIFWVIGIAILALLVLSKGDLGLFAIGYTSNEPDTLEGYETKLKDITFEGKISEFRYHYGGYDIEPDWNECVYENFECFMGQTEPCKPRCPTSLSILWDSYPDNLIIKTPLDPEYHGVTNCKQYISFIKSDISSDVNVLDTILLKKGIEVHKIIYEMPEGNSTYYVWCNNENAIHTNNELIADLYFNTFYDEEETCSNEPTTLSGYDSQLACSYNQAGNLNCFIDSTEFFIVKLDFEEIGMGVSSCKEYTEELVGYENKIATTLGFDIYRLTDALTFCNQNAEDLYVGVKIDDIDKLTPYFDKYYTCEQPPIGTCADELNMCGGPCPPCEEPIEENTFAFKLWMALTLIGVILLIAIASKM